MASLKVNICLFVLFHAIFLLSSEVLGYGGNPLSLSLSMNIFLWCSYMINLHSSVVGLEIFF
jgi:hypothetical protein